jgi:hypothetical protein
VGFAPGEYGYSGYCICVGRPVLNSGSGVEGCAMLVPIRFFRRGKSGPGITRGSGGGGIPLNEEVAVPTSVAAVDGVRGRSLSSL